MACLLSACGGGSTPTADAPLALVDAPVDAPLALPDARSAAADAPPPDARPDAAPPDAVPADAGPSTGPSLIDPSLALEVWKVAGVVGNAGTIEVQVGTQAVPDYVVVNAVADLNGDGQIAPYATPSGMQDEWLVQNLPLPAIDRRFALGFALQDTALAAKTSVPVRVTVGSARVASAPGLAWTDSDGSRKVAATVRLKSLAAFTPPPAGFVGQGVVDYNTEWLSEPLSTFDNGGDLFYRNQLGKAPPGINNCVPGTVAANLANLGARDGWSGGLRDGPGGSLFDPSTNEGIQGLQDYLTLNSDQWNWSVDKGVSLGKIVAGKNELADKMGLPIMTSYIAAGPGVDLNVAIEENLRDGCAVELILGVPAAAGGVAGHMVGVAGFVQAGDFPTNFIIRDGTTSRLNDYVPIDADGNVPGYNQGGKRVTATAAGIVVECTTKVDAVKLDYPQGTLPTGALVHLRCVTGGIPDSSGPGCPCMHLHGDISISGYGGPYADQAPDNCGHGCIVQALPKDLTAKCFGPM
jgi:hypothetical protein